MSAKKQQNQDDNRAEFKPVPDERPINPGVRLKAKLEVVRSHYKTKVIENTGLSDVISPNLPHEEEKPGSTLNETNKLWNATLEAEGVPENQRGALIAKWRADIRAAKGEVTTVERIAPEGWRTLSLSEQDAVVAHGKANPWKSENGIRNGQNPFEWIFDTYQAWIPGLTQGLLRTTDFSLWSDLQTTISNARKGFAVVPSYFKTTGPDGERLLVPADKDARLLSMVDPAEKEALLALRKQKATDKAAARARPTRGTKAKRISGRTLAK